MERVSPEDLIDGGRGGFPASFWRFCGAVEVGAEEGVCPVELGSDGRFVA